MKKKPINIRMPEQLIEDLKMLAGDGSYQKMIVSMLEKSVCNEITNKIPQIKRENAILRERIKLLEIEKSELSA